MDQDLCLYYCLFYLACSLFLLTQNSGLYQENWAKVGFKEKARPGFETGLVASTWALAIFLLFVSVPHSYEVIHRYERGDESFRDIKSVLLAVTIEVIAALVLLIALHGKKLEEWQRQTMRLLF